jgi:hypothetical protein
MNKINKFLAIFLFLFSGSLSAKNIELTVNDVNCRKIDGYGTNDKMSLASTFKVPVSSISFLDAKWMPGKYGSNQCLMIFDTAAGPKKCSISIILSGDGGKTAFGVLDLLNRGFVNTCF